MHELGEVVSGKVPWKVGQEDVTLFHETNGEFGDAALAAYVYDEARKRGIGRTLSL